MFACMVVHLAPECTGVKSTPAWRDPCVIAAYPGGNILCGGYCAWHSRAPRILQRCGRRSFANAGRVGIGSGKRSTMVVDACETSCKALWTLQTRGTEMHNVVTHLWVYRRKLPIVRGKAWLQATPTEKHCKKCVKLF